MKDQGKMPAPGAAAGLLLVALASVLFSCKGVFVKICYGMGADPVTVMCLRMLFSLPLFIAMAWWDSARRARESAAAPPLGFRDMLSVLALGITGYYLASLFDFEGLKHVSAGLERLLLFTYPTFVVLLSALLPGGRWDRGFLLPLGLSYAGIAFSFAGEAGIAGDGWLGSGLILLSALLYAGFLIGSGRVIHRIGATRLTALSMMVASVAVVAHFVATRPLAGLQQPLAVYGIAMGLAAFATALPSVMMAHGVRLIGSSRAAIASGIGPVATFALAGWMLGEVVGLPQIAGLVFTLTGGILLTRRKKPA